MYNLKDEFCEELYSTLPWYRKLLKSINKWFKNKFINIKFPWLKIILLGILVVFVFSIYIVIEMNKQPFPVRSPYDKTGFFTKEEVLEEYGDETIIENEKYKMVFNNQLTTFNIYDKNQDTTWDSNPNESSNRFLNPINVFYASNLGQVESMGVIEQAVEYDDYYLRISDKSIEVLYEIGGKKEIDSSDFPTLITDQRMQDLILSNFVEGSMDYRRITEQAYVFGDVKGQQVWKLKNGIQYSILEKLYEIFYEKCGYTVDDLKYDQESNGIVIEDIYPYFEVAIKYEINNDGFQIKLINDSIVEKEKYPLIYIDVLPYFGAGALEDDGYIFVPDGSGGLIDFNSDRSFALPYNKRIYGVDYASFKEEIPSDNLSIRLPVTGIIKNDKGLVSIVNKGAEMTNIIANISSQHNPYNQVYYRYNFREGEEFDFVSINSSVSINEWTMYYNTMDFVIDVRFIDDDHAEYCDMADIYREYLIQEGTLVQKDNTHRPTLDLTLLGGYTIKENFMGIPYETVKSLTNTEEVVLITESLLASGIEDINIFYKGFSNEGLRPSYMGDIDFDKNTGKEKDFIELTKRLDELNVNFYPEVYINTAYTDKGINVKKVATRDVFGEIVYNYSYNPAAMIQDTNTRKWYTLRGDTYEDTLYGIQEQFMKFNATNIAFTDFGNQIYGSYQKKDTIFKYQNANEFLNTMEMTAFNNMMFRNPNLYAIPYTSIITDVEYSSSNYQIISKSIPFYQLVFSGYLDYSGKSFNTFDEYSLNYHLMKSIETLSNISFDLSYKSTIELVDTEYSMYYSTLYSNWIDILLEYYQELVILDIYNSKLINHQIITEDGLVSKSTYSNSTVIVFNYRATDYQYDDNTIIEANNYVVLERGNDVD